MKQISEHFKRSEFACKCGCGFDAADIELVGVLEVIRAEFGPTIITSGCRCLKHNTTVEGSLKSQHMIGKAADFWIVNLQNYLPSIYAWLNIKYPGQYGIGLYDNWIHIDVRPDNARWDFRR